jgi:hypothetical protein
MTRMLFGLALCALAATSPSVRAQGVEGNWNVSYIIGGAQEATYAIVKLETKDGKTTGELVADRGGTLKTVVKSVTQEGANLRIVLGIGATELTFEAVMPKEAAKNINGVMEINGTLFPARITATEDQSITAATKLVDCPPMTKARQLQATVNTLRLKANASKDPETKKDLIQQANEADKTAKAETPKLYREVLDKHAKSPAVFEASLALIRSAKASAANPGDVTAWASAGAAAAKTYGPRYEAEFASQIANALLTLNGMEKTALEYARVAEKSINDKSPAAEQIRILSIVARTLKKAGQTDDGKALEVRVEKLELVADKDYAVKMPAPKAVAFEGRKSKSDRAAFMELFTGATCPPCVAADLAFDTLQKTYKPTEAVLIQYHMHIPGPDPMTNADTEARWAYYRKAHPGKVTGVPSSMFNGKPQGGGGGPAGFADKKYEAYRGIIDPILEENAGAKMTAEAVRNGDNIEINVKVSDLNDPGADKKLRILLAEETVRYAGSNKIRLHHNVVRAFPGGVDGVALKEAATRHKASVNVSQLRDNLTKYLDAFEASGKSFANPARPMALNHLRVIAFVQDDNSHEILQAVQVNVESK